MHKEEVFLIPIPDGHSWLGDFAAGVRRRGAGREALAAFLAGLRRRAVVTAAEMRMHLRVYRRERGPVRRHADPVLPADHHRTVRGVRVHDRAAPPDPVFSRTAAATPRRTAARPVRRHVTPGRYGQAHSAGHGDRDGPGVHRVGPRSSSPCRSPMTCRWLRRATCRADGRHAPMLFSGTVFVATEQGFSVELVPWSAEASYRMPVSVWRELVDAHFPARAWPRPAGHAGRAVAVQGAECAAHLGRHPDRAPGCCPRRRASGRARSGGRDGGDAAVNLDPVRSSRTRSRTRATSCTPTGLSGAEEPEPLELRWRTAPGYAAAEESETITRAECVLEHGGSRPVRSYCGSCRSSGGPPAARVLLPRFGTRRWQPESRRPRTVPRCSATG